MRVRARRTVALVAAIAALVAGAVAGGTTAPPPRSLPPNIVVIITDDQSIGSLPSEPPAMPWLQAQLADPAGHWLTFTDAVVSTPLCCPSRATMLTGRYARHTGVVDNESGQFLDDTDTVAVWLHDAGYRTALVGKYLNRYPFGGDIYVPPGWDRWFAKENASESTTYYDYSVADQARLEIVGHTPADYATDLLGRTALDFVRTAPGDEPWFLWFAPIAPHGPWTPAPRYAHTFEGVTLPRPDDRVLNDVEGKPAWNRELPPIDAVGLADLQRDRLAERRALLAVDDAVRQLYEAVAARGELDRTVFLLISDNGFAYGEHRWEGKGCPYEECIRVPFAIRSPWADAGRVDDPVANVDLAPTIASLAGVVASPPQDGVSLAAIVRGEDSHPPHRSCLLIDWPSGFSDLPRWVGLRTRRYVFVRDRDGTLELYDLAADPNELRNLATDRPSSMTLRRLSDRLDRCLASLPPSG
jgi:N-acetylglucosamine-6-sulfatase